MYFHRERPTLKTYRYWLIYKHRKFVSLACLLAKRTRFVTLYGAKTCHFVSLAILNAGQKARGLTDLRFFSHCNHWYFLCILCKYPSKHTTRRRYWPALLPLHPNNLHKNALNGVPKRMRRKNRGAAHSQIEHSTASNSPSSPDHRVNLSVKLLQIGQHSTISTLPK